MASRFKSPRRVVVKVGSAVLARGGVLSRACVRRLARDVNGCLRADAKRRVVLVSSGAIASGFRALGLERRPMSIADKQAAAAVGQPRLMAEYAAAFGALRPARTLAQVLLTSDDLEDPERFLNARHTLERLLDAAVVPIINENDSVSFEEIKLGDNDRLSALMAGLVEADLLIMLSSVPGVCRAGKREGEYGAVVPVIRSLEEALEHVSAGVSGEGTGGMANKVGAACRAAARGIGVVIADGGMDDVVRRVVAGEEVGTYFPPAGVAEKRAVRGRKL
ncbi:MAG: glutamate 5-kinase [Phycisphaerales bacterium]|nr:glutamate 5-kinase [Phycisphaerales bacterium]